MRMVLVGAFAGAALAASASAASCGGAGSLQERVAACATSRTWQHVTWDLVTSSPEAAVWWNRTTNALWRIPLAEAASVRQAEARERCVADDLVPGSGIKGDLPHVWTSLEALGQGLASLLPTRRNATSGVYLGEAYWTSTPTRVIDGYPWVFAFGVSFFDEQSTRPFTVGPQEENAAARHPYVCYRALGES